MYTQLALNISLPNNVSFSNFIMGNNLALCTLQDFCQGKSQEQHLYLWGDSGVGKTHLLQAVCHSAAESGCSSTYIPLHQAAELAPSLLHDLQDLNFIAIDDVHSIATLPGWEQALFVLYQHALITHTKIVWSAQMPPARLALQLADLQSRLAASLVLEVQPLTDSDKITVLQQRATARGLALPEQVGHYLLAHCPRHMGELLAILDKLDQAAWVAQRGLTIPFVKQVLGM